VFSGQKRVEKQVFGQKSINPNFLATIVAEIWEKQATCHLFFFSKIKGGCLPHVQIKKKRVQFHGLALAGLHMALSEMD